MMFKNDISNGITILECVENDDGTTKFVIDLSPEFEKWFCETYNVQSIEQDCFDRWFQKSLEDGLKKIIEEKKDE